MRVPLAPWRSIEEPEQRALRLRAPASANARVRLEADRARPLARCRSSSSAPAVLGAALGRVPAKIRSEPPCVGSCSTSKSSRPWRAKTRSHRHEARSTRSARGRSCRTASARSARAGAGTPCVITPSAASSIAIPATKSLRSGTWASTLFPTRRSARRPRHAASAAARARRTRHASGCPSRPRPPRRSLPARSPSTGIAALDEVLEQVAVVARDLDDDGSRRRARTARVTSLDVARERARASVRERREVRVVAEDLVRRRRELGELHEVAVARRRTRGGGRRARPRRAAPARR